MEQSQGPQRPRGPKAPSRMAALVPGPGVPTAPELESRLRAAGIGVEGLTETLPNTSAAVWQGSALLRFPGRPEVAHYTFLVHEGLRELPQADWEHKLTDQERAAAGQCTVAVATETEFGDDPLADFHRQAQLLTALAPDAPVILDETAQEVHSGAWLREVAGASVPPGPGATISVHPVSEGRPGAERLWLHSHGLGRWGLPELEMVDIPVAVGVSLRDLMLACASMFLCYGPPAPGERFRLGGAELVWLPWEEAVRHVPRGVWSEDRDMAHGGPSVVLLRPPGGLLRRGYGNPASLAKQIDRNNPVVPLSTSETQRMAALAREWLPRFRALHARHGDNAEEWLFLIKIGLPVDPEVQAEEGAPQAEHLWFRVAAMHDDAIEGTLLNQPLGIRALREGQEGTWALDGLSDWAILCKYGHYDPSTVFFLERHCAAAEEA